MKSHTKKHKVKLNPCKYCGETEVEIVYNRFNNQIVKAEVKIKDEITSKYNSYYAYYPVPVIKYNNNVIKNIYIDNTKTLKYITYNADGRNPLFNKNKFYTKAYILNKRFL